MCDVYDVIGVGRGIRWLGWGRDLFDDWNDQKVKACDECNRGQAFAVVPLMVAVTKCVMDMNDGGRDVWQVKACVCCNGIVIWTKCLMVVIGKGYLMVDEIGKKHKWLRCDGKQTFDNCNGNKAFNGCNGKDVWWLQWGQDVWWLQWERCVLWVRCNGAWRWLMVVMGTRLLFPTGKRHHLRFLT